MLDIPLPMIFICAAREQAHNNNCGPLPQKGWMPVAKQILHACTKMLFQNFLNSSNFKILQIGSPSAH
jgi:hypothetical protein